MFLLKPSLSSFGLFCNLTLFIGQVDKIVDGKFLKGSALGFLFFFFKQILNVILIILLKTLKINDFIFLVKKSIVDIFIFKVSGLNLFLLISK